MVKAVENAGSKKLVVAGLWTEVCVVMPVLDALEDGYEVYVVTDASGGVTTEAHDMAVERMVQAVQHELPGCNICWNYNVTGQTKKRMMKYCQLLKNMVEHTD